MMHAHLVRTTLLLFAICACVLVHPLAPPHAEGATPEEKGLQIARDTREKAKGFGNFTAEQSMVLRNKHGQESKRQLRVKVLETDGGGNKSLFVFDRPRDVRGTALLVHTHKNKNDDQWLYLPALKRVKRISSSNQSGSFMGSEFAYEDMGTQEVEKFTYRYLRDEPCGKLTCTVVERFPTNKRSGYRRQIVWQDKSELRAWKVQYFDRKNSHLKTLTLGNYKKYLGKYWQSQEMNMVNHLTGKSTVLRWNNYKFRTSLKDSEFTRTGLKRVR